jgi:hypothetical protein
VGRIRTKVYKEMPKKTKPQLELELADAVILLEKLVDWHERRQMHSVIDYENYEDIWDRVRIWLGHPFSEKAMIVDPVLREQGS